jgi:deoxyribonuclease V
MKLQHIHAWDVTPKQAIEIQRQLQHRVIKTDRLNSIRFVAGVDVGFENKNKVTRAAVALLTFPQLELFEHAIVRRDTVFPYVPGLLSFRESPAVLEALAALHQKPDLLLCDGQGFAHPRRFGLACHLGVLADIPSIGVAKTRLIGEHEPVGDKRGAWVPLTDKNETIGAVLRTREKVKPLFISIGHRVSLETAIKLVMRCTTKYRLPETTRWAHRLASGKGNDFKE